MCRGMYQPMAVRARDAWRLAWAAGPALARGWRPDPESASDVATALRGYLQERLGAATKIDFTEPPSPMVDGWETYIYAFRLQGSGLPPHWREPLVLRIHAAAHGVARARTEFAVADHLCKLGYPVAAPILKEESAQLFGGPFLIMENVRGTPLLRAMFRKPWKLFDFPAQLARAHAALHALPTLGCPLTAGSFLERRLGSMRTSIAELDLGGLAAGLDWLDKHRPEEPVQSSIVHLDFHPLNLIERTDGTLAVLDWTYAELGDPHADVATTLMILEAIPTSASGLWQRIELLVGRPLTAGQYLRTYRQQRPLDARRLDYYRACATVHQLVRYGRWLRCDPLVSDCKRSVVGHLSEQLLESLYRYFARGTGVAISL